MSAVDYCLFLQGGTDEIDSSQAEDGFQLRTHISWMNVLFTKLLYFKTKITVISIFGYLL